jgi:hypothetical protein
MPKYSKESLEKLLVLIDEICNKNENLWFKEKIQENYSLVSVNKNTSNESINKIYEYCIKEIISKQAHKFYEGFKLEEIKPKLIEDFIRMEHFRRDDNFEDFCLAMFQQLEGTINSLVSKEMQNYFIENKHLLTHKVWNKDTKENIQKELWELVFYPKLSSTDLEIKINKPINEWDFSERFKAVLFYYYFKKRIYNLQDFQSIFFLGNDLYQSRNLNHRGGKTTESQQKIIDKVTSDSHKYYFKFLGFLEDILSTLNKNI